MRCAPTARAKNGKIPIDIVNGMGADTDIVVASAKAYVNALNKLGHMPHVNPQYGESTATA